MSDIKVVLSATWFCNVGIERFKMVLSGGFIDRPFRVLTHMALSDATMTFSGDIGDI